MNVMKIVLSIKNWKIFYKFSIMSFSKIINSNLFYFCICFVVVVI